MAESNLITPACLREFFKYSPETGDIRWIKTPSPIVKVGGLICGKNRAGYIRVVLNKKDLLAHRVAWALFHHAWPSGMIDHINGDKADNRIVNLRDVSRSVNTQNQKKAHKSNLSSGLLGVQFFKRTGRWRTQIWVNGKSSFLGYFDTKEQAHEVYLQNKRLLHHGCTI